MIRRIERSGLDRDIAVDADEAFDRAVVKLCEGPTIDLGWGPGRLVVDLIRRGIPALGVDQSATAVAPGNAASQAFSSGTMKRSSPVGVNSTVCVTGAAAVSVCRVNVALRSAATQLTIVG